MDFGARYRFDFEEHTGRNWGELRYAIRGNWLIEQNDFVNIDDPTDADIFADTVGNPRVRFLSTLTWAPTEALAFTWDWDWQASQEIEDLDNLVGNTDRYENLKYIETGDYSQHDFSVRYDMRDDLTLRAGVTNAFDADPVPWLENTTSDNFDLFGRRFYIGFNYRPY